MKLFECQNCGQLIYFENTLCERCGFALGFLPDTAMMTALQPDGSGAFTPLADRSRTVSYCANFTHGACNWLINSGCGPLCQACELNRTIPDLTQPENLRLWQQIEIAKRRLVYSLLRLGLPILSKTEAPHAGTAFTSGAAAGRKRSGQVPRATTRRDHAQRGRSRRRRALRFSRRSMSLTGRCSGISATRPRIIIGTGSSRTNRPTGFSAGLRR